MAYSERQRNQGLELHQRHGPAEASRRTGVPRATISSWARRAGVSTAAPERTAAAVEVARLRWAQRRTEMADELGELAAELLACVRVRVREEGARSVRDLMVSVGIAIDKAQLLSGGASDRPEHRQTIRPEVVEAELDRLAAEVAERASHRNGN